MTTDTERARKLETIWKRTPAQYRAVVDGRRAVLTLRAGATCLVPLDLLTDDEIAYKQPTNGRQEDL